MSTHFKVFFFFSGLSKPVITRFPSNGNNNFQNNFFNQRKTNELELNGGIGGIQRSHEFSKISPRNSGIFIYHNNPTSTTTTTGDLFII